MTTVAEFWDKSEARHELIVYPALAPLLESLHAEKYLDIGCGAGKLQSYLTQKKNQVVGLDADINAVNICRDKGLDSVIGSATNIPFSSDTFSCAYASLSLLYLNPEEFNAAFTETYRVLKNNGQFVVADIHPFHSYNPHKTPLVKVQRSFHRDYFSNQIQRAEVVDSKTKLSTEVWYYHRSFQTWFDTAKKSGFSINQVIEPRPQKPHPSLMGESIFPSYILFSMVKL